MATLSVQSITIGTNKIYKVSGFAASGDVSNWIRVPKHLDRNVHALGSFTGGLSLAVEGSNEADVAVPTSAVALRDSQGNVLALTAAALEQILENTEWIRIHATAGAGGGNAVCYIKFIR